MIKLIQGKNDFLTWCKQNDREDLLVEWNKERNYPLTPDVFSAGSSKKAWWICKCGHEWQTSIVHRTRGRGCPYCAGRVVMIGETDLSTTNPALAKEWDLEKNYPLTPLDVTSGSGKKVWWKDALGHSWNAQIASRSAGSGCPYCSNQRILKGFNDLATINPELAKEWDYNKNGDISPCEVGANSNKIVWWKCTLGHEWQSSISNRSRRGDGCPFCSGKRALKGFNDLHTVNPEVASQWNYKKNGDLSPCDLTAHSGKKVWWICDRGHEWQAIVDSRAGKRKTGCPYCKKGVLLSGFNDLKTVNPELALQWDYTKNGSLTPENVYARSTKKVWWLCKEGHDWQATIGSRLRGGGCPYCAGQRVWKGYNDLATINPELASEWNYEKNVGILPSDITPSSGKKVWWKCKYGHQWQASPNNRSNDIGCPYCSNKGSSKPEQGIAYYLSQCCVIQQRIKIQGKEIDVFLPEYNIGIEYDGCYYHKNRLEEDSRKNLALENSGIHLYRIIESNQNIRKGNFIYFKTDYLGANYEWALNTLLKCLYDLTNNIEFEQIDVDAQRDSVAIRERYDLIKKENSIEAKRPELAKEWNYDKNGILKPDMFDVWSNEKVWWICKTGHEWKASINDRSRGDGCPYCAGKKVLVGFNDLATLRPKLAEEWDYSKNGKLIPQAVTVASNKKVWWKCSIGHEWKASITHRATRGHGCPICSHHQLLPGFNDLNTTNPELAKEWDYEKNGDLTPKDVAGRTSLKVWWKCEKGHQWQTTINNRAKGTGCPYCVNLQVLKGYNDLSTTNPQLASEWNPEKNADLTPDKVTSGSTKKVWWKCTNGHAWQATIASRSNGCGCPICSGRQAWTGVNDLQTLFPIVAAEWNYEKNEELLPNQVSAQSNKKVWWKCEKGHEWQAVICSRANGCGCPYCKGKYAIRGETDICTTNPELAKEWNYDKNGSLIPEDVTAGSQKRVWWKCAKGHEWQATIGNRSKGKGCPYCSGNRTKPIKNVETGEVFTSLSKAAQSCGLKDGTTISLCCRGKNSTAGGYHWEYVD